MADNMVSVFLPRDSLNNVGDYVGWINGKKFTVPRGVQVQIPSEQAEVLQNTMKQDGVVAIMLDNMEQRAAQQEALKSKK